MNKIKEALAQVGVKVTISQVASWVEYELYPAERDYLLSGDLPDDTYASFIQDAAAYFEGRQ